MRTIRVARARIGIRGVLIAASAVALCLPLAACGGSGSGSTGGDNPGASPTVSADTTVPVACHLLSADLIAAHA